MHCLHRTESAAPRRKLGLSEVKAYGTLQRIGCAVNGANGNMPCNNGSAELAADKSVSGLLAGTFLSSPMLSATLSALDRNPKSRISVVRDGISGFRVIDL